MSRLLRGDPNQPADQHAAGKIDGTAGRRLELALTEIFNFYTRKYQEPYDGIFEVSKENLYRLGLRGYSRLVSDMQIPIDKARVTAIWKKCAPA